MTTKTLVEVTAAIQDIVIAAVSGANAPDSLPDTEYVTDPSIYTYPESGSSIRSAYSSTELHTFAVDLVCNSEIYSTAYAVGVAALDKIIRALAANPTLGATVSTFGSITYSFDRPSLTWSIKINDCKILDY